MCAIVLAIACMIARAIFLVGPGLKPLALHTIYFVGPEFEPLALQHDLFVGPGFRSLALITCFRPGVSLAYVTFKDKIKILCLFLPDSNTPSSRCNHDNCRAVLFLHSDNPTAATIRVKSAITCPLPQPQGKSSVQRGNIPPAQSA